jgi:catechol 2,3-dioxygenase-like lactoylglutathione lyase family enzyme
MSLILDYDNFFLPVENLEKAKEFYGNLLGLETKFDFSDKGMTAFKIGDNDLQSFLVQYNIPNRRFGLPLPMSRQHMNGLRKKGSYF